MVFPKKPMRSAENPKPLKWFSRKSLCFRPKTSSPLNGFPEKTYAFGRKPQAPNNPKPRPQNGKHPKTLETLRRKTQNAKPKTQNPKPKGGGVPQDRPESARFPISLEQNSYGRKDPSVFQILGSQAGPLRGDTQNPKRKTQSPRNTKP